MDPAWLYTLRNKYGPDRVLDVFEGIDMEEGWGEARGRLRSAVFADIVHHNVFLFIIICGPSVV